MELKDADIEAYVEQHSSKESASAQKLVQTSKRELEHIDMLSGRVVGQLLAMLVKISGAKHVLEIGTFTGYSALRMAEALPDEGTLITCELNEHYESIARDAFESNVHGHKITLKMGPALGTIASLDQSFDFIFLDADKINYPNYYNACVRLLTKGGVIVIDNVLWKGTVLEPKDEKAQAIDKLNKMIADDERVEQVMLTVRDGVTIVRKRY